MAESESCLSFLRSVLSMLVRYWSKSGFQNAGRKSSYDSAELQWILRQSWVELELISGLERPSCRIHFLNYSYLVHFLVVGTQSCCFYMVRIPLQDLSALQTAYFQQALLPAELVGHTCYWCFQLSIDLYLWHLDWFYLESGREWNFVEAPNCSQNSNHSRGLGHLQSSAKPCSSHSAVKIDYFPRPRCCSLARVSCRLGPSSSYVYKRLAAN